MLPDLTRPATGRLLAEQLRMVHANTAISYGATFAAAVITAALLPPAGEPALLLGWLAAVGLWCVAALWLARHYLRAPQPLAAAVRVYRFTFALYAPYGALWALLPWLMLDPGSMLNTVWVVCVMAGVLTGGMTFMAPLLPVFTAFALLLVVPLTVKFLTLDGFGYFAIGIGSFVMLLTILGQATRTSSALRSMIELRMAHENLMAQLREESARTKEALISAEEARHEAEAGNRAKSTFLAAASHDLRQPIHAQGLFLEVLAGTPLSPHQRDVLASARSASQASGEMLNTLLDFSRIEAGVVKPQRQPFALQTLLHKIENDLAPLADAKAIAYRSPETDAIVESDPTLVEMILRNLMSNAIRYTERGGVLIACRRRSQLLVVEVRDTGIGIAPEHQREVFREFHQLGNPERDRRKGLGLGLAIAQGLANALGHSLTLTSRRGRGSIFRLALPLTHAAAVSVVPAFASGARQLQGVRVLVLDDDEAVRDGMAHLLRSWGCLPDTAESISAALELAQRQAPAVVISDYRLRGQSTGADAIVALRALLGPHLPALLITGDTAPKRLREASISGVPLLHKPVPPDQLFHSLTQLVWENNASATAGISQTQQAQGVA